MKKLILEYQNKWASGIVEIGKTKNNFKESNILTLNSKKSLKELKWHPKLNFKETLKLTSVENHLK